MPQRLNTAMRRDVVIWVSREILPHEASVRRWLSGLLDHATIEDIIQESYCRIAGLPHVGHIRSGRAYFFVTARNLALQHIRRQRLVRIETIAEIEALEIAEEQPSPERITAGRRQLRHVLELIESLPERCRQIIKLRKIQGLSQREVATRLSLPEYVVENDIAKGLKIIARALANSEKLAEARLERVGNEQRARDSTGNR